MTKEELPICTVEVLKFLLLEEDMITGDEEDLELELEELETTMY